MAIKWVYKDCAHTGDRLKRLLFEMLSLLVKIAFAVICTGRKYLVIIL